MRNAKVLSMQSLARQISIENKLVRENYLGPHLPSLNILQNLLLACDKEKDWRSLLHNPAVDYFDGCVKIFNTAVII